MAALGQPSQLTNVRGDESELLLSPRKLRLCHQTVTFGNRWRSQAGVLPVIQQLASDGCCALSQEKENPKLPLASSLSHTWLAVFNLRSWVLRFGSVLPSCSSLGTDSLGTDSRPVAAIPPRVAGPAGSTTTTHHPPTRQVKAHQRTPTQSNPPRKWVGIEHINQRQ